MPQALVTVTPVLGPGHPRPRARSPPSSGPGYSRPQARSPPSSGPGHPCPRSSVTPVLGTLATPILRPQSPPSSVLSHRAQSPLSLGPGHPCSVLGHPHPWDPGHPCPWARSPPSSGPGHPRPRARVTSAHLLQFQKSQDREGEDEGGEGKTLMGYRLSLEGAVCLVVPGDLILALKT